MNRYSYVYNNPVRYTDSTGHCPMCLAAVFGISKGIDYGLTAWDTYQSRRVLLDPNASDADKMFASLNIALAAGFELLEPDDYSPIGLPADDIARRAFLDGARTAFDEGGERGLRGFIRDNAGDGADDLLRHIGLGCSFSEDTLVITEEGFKEISDLQIGDLVLAYNEALDTIDIYPITAVWSHFDPIIVHLTLDNEQIETTPEHPFFIAGDKWVAAGDLWLGAQVLKSDGTYGTVRAIEKQKRPQIMYNLTVDTAHTYFVGRQQWLVHNDCWLTPGGRRVDPDHLDKIYYERGFDDWELDDIIDDYDRFLVQENGAGVHMRDNRNGTYDVVIVDNENFIVTAFRGLDNTQLNKNIRKGWWYEDSWPDW